LVKPDERSNSAYSRSARAGRLTSYCSEPCPARSASSVLRLAPASVYLQWLPRSHADYLTRQNRKKRKKSRIRAGLNFQTHISRERLASHLDDHLAQPVPESDNTNLSAKQIVQLDYRKLIWKLPPVLLDREGSGQTIP
jgi:hypothetical protein